MGLERVLEEEGTDQANAHSSILSLKDKVHFSPTIHETDVPLGNLLCRQHRNHPQEGTLVQASPTDQSSSAVYQTTWTMPTLLLKKTDSRALWDMLRLRGPYPTPFSSPSSSSSSSSVSTSTVPSSSSSAPTFTTEEGSASWDRFLRGEEQEKQEEKQEERQEKNGLRKIRRWKDWRQAHCDCSDFKQ